MADAILWFGGNINRGYKAAEIAIHTPGTTVIVSSEDDPRGCLNLLQAAGLPRERIILDYSAWDTVTNVVKTFPLVRRLGARKLYCVSDGFHMRRVMAITEAAYCLRGISAVACPSSPADRQESDALVSADRLRASVWRWTGYLKYDQSVYDARWPSIEAAAKIAATL